MSGNFLSSDFQFHCRSSAKSFAGRTGNAVRYIGQLGLQINGLDQGMDSGNTLATAVGTGKQTILSR